MTTRIGSATFLENSVPIMVRVQLGMPILASSVITNRLDTLAYAFSKVIILILFEVAIERFIEYCHRSSLQVQMHVGTWRLQE